MPMSVVIAVKVSEGLVLAADSAATIQGNISNPEYQHRGVLKTFFNARKVLQLSDFPIGIATWGAATIGMRTLESLVREWEHETEWQSLKKFQQKGDNVKYSVKECTKQLHQHLMQIHEEAYAALEEKDRPPTGFLVAGYSESKFFPEMYRFVIPVDKNAYDQRPDINGKPQFGASWFGLTEPIIRLHFGRGDVALNILSEKLQISIEELSKILAPCEYPMAFAQMPLQDAIEYANYMINVVIGRYRFVLGPELCGGEVDIAVITQQEFKWIKQKSWQLD
jgi:hypothetical protein